MRALNQRVLIDHFGLAKATGGVAQPGFRELLDLMGSPNVYMKLSGPYQISDQGPAYADIEPFRMEDDGPRDIGLIKDWAPDARLRLKLPVDNPAQVFGFR